MRLNQLNQLNLIHGNPYRGKTVSSYRNSVQFIQFIQRGGYPNEAEPANLTLPENDQKRLHDGYIHLVSDYE